MIAHCAAPQDDTCVIYKGRITRLCTRRKSINFALLYSVSKQIFPSWSTWRYFFPTEISKKIMISFSIFNIVNIYDAKLNFYIWFARVFYFFINYSGVYYYSNVSIFLLKTNCFQIGQKICDDTDENDTDGFRTYWMSINPKTKEAPTCRYWWCASDCVCLCMSVSQSVSASSYAHFPDEYTGITRMCIRSLNVR